MERSIRTLIGCAGLSASLGTVHAWSLFLEPLENHLDVGRGWVSAVYSVCLAAITAAVLVGHRLFTLLPGWCVVGLSAGGATVGLVGAAQANHWWLLVLSYGLIFGLANGIGYSFALQRSSEATPTASRSLALVTAAYALGAAAAAIALKGPVDAHGAARGFLILAGCVGASGIAAALLVGGTRSPKPDRRISASLGLSTSVVRIWVSYGLASLAGLTALGHAAAIVDLAGGPGGTTVALTGFASAAGGIAMVAVVRPFGQRIAALVLPLSTATLLATAALAEGVGWVAATSVIGVAAAYGALIAIYPAIVHRRFGARNYPTAYGRVFTAWGLAGLLGPLGAGALFDASGGYRLPLFLAAILAITSTFVARGTSTCETEFDSTEKASF